MSGPVEIISLDTPSLGDRSYVAHDGRYAIVVDPQRDLDRITDVVARHGLRVTHVLEAGARLRIRVLHTPGHTFTHLSYALEADGRVAAVFTGGSLLYGSTGRPDLLGADHAETLARAQHASAHRLAGELPGDTPIYPTHGFGSFCAATQSAQASSTLAAEARANPALTQDAERFVRTLLAELDAYPAYYAHMAPANAAGPTAADLAPPRPAEPAELRRRIEAGEWVVDLRARTAFAAGHVAGTLNLGLDGSFATYLGWLMPWGTPVTLLGDSPEAVAAAQRDLARIGIDRPAGAATGKPEDWAGGAPLATLRTATFADLATRSAGDSPPPAVLDVRRHDERRDSRLDGSLHLPIHELPDRLADVPRDRPVWVHCATGYRAAVAASLLARAGVEVVLVDDEYESARSAGLPVAVPAR